MSGHPTYASLLLVVYLAGAASLIVGALFTVAARVVFEPPDDRLLRAALWARLAMVILTWPVSLTAAITAAIYREWRDR